MNFDFMAAKLKHSMWKLHLHEFLEGKPGLSEAQATNHKECDLGKWLYSEGLTKYGSIPEMKALEAEHERLHDTVRTIMALKTAGKTADAKAALAGIDAVSKRVVELLVKVEMAVAQRA
jgi:hypothetical protein